MEPRDSMPHSQERSKSTQFLVLIPISLRSILILSSHLRLGLPKGLFPVGFRVKTLKVLLPSAIRATRLARPNILNLNTPTKLGERYKQWIPSLRSLLHSPLSSLFDTNFHLFPCSNTLSLHSSLNVRGHVSQPYSTTGNIIVKYNLILIFLERSLEDNVYWIMTSVSIFKSIS